MSAEECDGDDFSGRGAGVVQDRDRGGGRAPGGGDLEDSGLGEAGQFAEAGAANYADVDGL